ncbi:MAG TPA: YidB family protein [Chthoniobacter sp.]|jgi:uncharacterized protein YidB (DUF937 family)
MGLFDSILGSVLGGGNKTQMLASLATTLITDHSSGNGLAGLAQQFEQQGLGHLMQSWVGNGTNLPITPDQVQQVLGNQYVEQFAAQHGVDLNTASSLIAQVLPQLVNHATPNGQIPPQGQVQSLIGGLLSSLGGSQPPAAQATS